MKRILFIIPSYNHGGTNKSLQNLLSFLDKDKYDVSIFSLRGDGPYKTMLAKYKILPRDIILSSILDSFNQIQKDKIIERITKIIVKSLFRVIRFFCGEKSSIIAYKIAARKISKQEYKTIVAFQEGEATHFSSFISGYKIAWVRCDYSEFFKFRNRNEEYIYSKYNHIVAVSEYTKNVFLSYYPSLREKCYGIHNIIDEKTIKNQANKRLEIDPIFITKYFRILSVGRLSKVKQFDIIPSIAAELKKDGYSFVWYIIGKGEEKSKILSLIDQYDVSEVVILLGEKNNPYPYFSEANLYISTSLSEACPNVINEAKILHTPVVTTDFGSAVEFLENEVNGFITNKENLKNVIEDLIDNKEKYKRIKQNLKSYKYTNDEILSRLQDIL